MSSSLESAIQAASDRLTKELGIDGQQAAVAQMFILLLSSSLSREDYTVPSDGNAKDRLLEKLARLDLIISQFHSCAAGVIDAVVAEFAGQKFGNYHDHHDIASALNAVMNRVEHKAAVDDKAGSGSLNHKPKDRCPSGVFAVCDRADGGNTTLVSKVDLPRFRTTPAPAAATYFQKDSKG